MDFEFGDTAQSRAYLDRTPKFLPFFIHAIGLGNQCYGREMPTKIRHESLCFDMGQTCRDDYEQIVFLAVNGYGIRATKLLRGLFERTVTLRYLVMFSEKTERFDRYSVIPEYRSIKAAIETTSESEVEQLLKETKGMTLEEIKRKFEEVKAEFQETVCKKCDKKNIAFTWDIDFSSMTKVTGEPLTKLYFAGYVIPNFHVHATRVSTNPSRPSEIQMAEMNRDLGNLALVTASQAFVITLDCQNTLFKLRLDNSHWLVMQVRSHPNRILAMHWLPTDRRVSTTLRQVLTEFSEFFM